LPLRRFSEGAQLNPAAQHANPTPTRSGPDPCHPHDPLPVFFTVLSFIAAGAGAIVVAIITAIAIERRSIEDVNARCLMSEGFTWAEVDADGLQVFLQGTAPDEASRFLAESRRGSVVDADRVVNNVDIRVVDVAPPPRFSLDMLRNGDGIQIIGLVPGANGGEEVASAIEAIADGAEVTDMVETADFPPPDTWISALGYGLRALRELPRSKVTVYADRVEVEAISDSAEQQAELLASCREDSRPGSRSSSTSPRRARSSRRFQLRAVLDAQGLRLDNCAADTPRAQERIIAAARRGAPRERSTAPSASAFRAPVGPPRSKRGLPRWSSWEAGPCPSATRPSR
jgi:OOP family OmpA-OmpF porin